jgi:hypothetical protein
MREWRYSSTHSLTSAPLLLVIKCLDDGSLKKLQVLKAFIFSAIHCRVPKE